MPALLLKRLLPLPAKWFVQKMSLGAVAAKQPHQKQASLALKTLLPPDIQQLLEIDTAYQRTVCEIRKRMRVQEFHPSWIDTLKKIVAMVKAGKLSSHTFLKGLQRLINVKGPLFNSFRDWLTQIEVEIKGLEPNPDWALKEFRFTFYRGLLHVQQKKLTLQEWQTQLASYRPWLPPGVYETIFLELTKYVLNSSRSDHAN